MTDTSGGLDSRSAGAAGSAEGPIITLYGRPGCHLCENALAELTPIAAAHGAAIVEVNIDLDDALLLRMLERIPVIEIAGAEVCELWVDPPAVTAALADARGAASAHAQPS